MRRVDVYLAVSAVAFVAGASALVDLALLGAGISLLAVATLAALFGVLHATDAPPEPADVTDGDDQGDDVPPTPYPRGL